MRATLAALTLILGLSACAVQPVPPDGPGRGYGPLRAYISPIESNGVNFYVNRPAYVALFEIVPGRGTSLVYPGPGLGRMDGFVYHGAHHLGAVRRHNMDQYLPAYGMAALGGPRFFFLIASERPLELDRIGAFGQGLVSTMGIQFASISAYSAMERLASTVLPSLEDDGSWTSDVYVYWPQALYDSPSRRAGLIQVRCNGYSMWVPVEYILAVERTVCAPQQDTDPRPREPQVGDSTRVGEPRVIEPRRRQPLPKAQAEDLRERITSSTQLEAPEARRAIPRGRSADAGRMTADGEPRERARTRGQEPRPGDFDRAEATRAREPRVASPRHEGSGRDENRGSTGPRSAEPRSAPEMNGASRGEPSSRPDTRSGDTPRAEPRQPTCNPCQQR